jgi:ABC-type nitrate/sulfonate/bicarbonate transport system permease component
MATLLIVFAGFGLAALAGILAGLNDTRAEAEPAAAES